MKRNNILLQEKTLKRNGTTAFGWVWRNRLLYCRLEKQAYKVHLIKHVCYKKEKLSFESFETLFQKREEKLKKHTERERERCT